MTWQKLTLTIPATLVETISDLLEMSGAVAVTCAAALEEELFEPAPGTTPLWQYTQITGLFTAETHLPGVKTEISNAIAPATVGDYCIETLVDQDWQKVCTDAFQPICFGQRLWVYPSWQPPPVSTTDKPSVLLDPGLAFGTGSHPTTALCLEWLAQHVRDQTCVIDYGCGSGILAIAALKLGAVQVWAVDNDPQALEATTENARRNHIAAHTLQVVDPQSLPPLQANVVVANILANPLVTLAPRLAAAVKPGGNIVLSGLLSDQEETVMQAYKPWFVFNPSVSKEGWLCISGEKMSESKGKHDDTND